MASILDNLPERGYQDNPNVVKLLSFPEDKVAEWANTMSNLYLELDANTCSDSTLDYLGYLFGFTGVFWNTEWSNIVKRNILGLGIKYWSVRGAESALLAWLNAIGIDCSIWKGSLLSLPFRMSKPMGVRRNKVVFRLPIEEKRNGYAWLEASRMASHLVPVMTPSRVSYETFRLGFSKLGEPMFSARIFAYDVTYNEQNISTDGTDDVTT